jgi:stage II sporulation protein GA (sporulation sigma-E factor processing peptidase)
MRVLYLDELFFLNLAVNYFILLATARVCGLRFRRGRYALTAALGAAWCCASLLPGLSWLDAGLMTAVLAATMALAAFGGEPKLWRCLASFLGVSALFGGAVFAAGLLRGTWTPGGRFVQLDMRVLVLSFAACWAAVSLLFRRTAKKAERRVLDVSVEYRGRTAHFRALEDTGNSLCDPLTGDAALVAEAAALSPLFPPSEAAALHRPAVEAMQALSGPGMRLLPCRGVGGRGLLLAFRPDRILVDGAERKDLLAAVSPAAMSDDASYQAVL